MDDTTDPQLEQLESPGGTDVQAVPGEETASTGTPPVQTPAQPIPAPEGDGMFAVYNETLLRFVGPTFATKSEASKAKSQLAKQGHKLTVRKV